MPVKLVSRGHFLLVQLICLAGVADARIAPLAEQRAIQPEPANSADIVVTGLPPRCQPQHGDPQDTVGMIGAKAGNRRQQTVQWDQKAGRYALVPDNFPITGTDIWQRSGTGLRDFIFRVPGEDKPICIGARKRFVAGIAQLRRAILARPHWGRYMILTADIAARRAGKVDMWIAAGADDPRPLVSDDDVRRAVVAGGFKQVPISGDYTWRRVNFLIGPIPCMAAQISYGIQLKGGGDVWLANPKIIDVPENKLSLSMAKRVHGIQMLQEDPICRHYLVGDSLYTLQQNNIVKLADDIPLHPGLTLIRMNKDHAYEKVRYDKAFAPGLIEF